MITQIVLQNYHKNNNISDDINNAYDQNKHDVYLR